IETQTSGASSPDCGHSDPPLIVVTAGGGADGFPMMAACVDALHVHGRRSRARALLITGPFMPRGERAALRARVEGLDAEVLWCVDESSSYLEQADLVMTMAGYNTLGEAVRLGRRTLVIPRPGPSAEQRIRAELFAARGLVTGVGTASSTPEELARLIGECLDSPPPLTRLPQRDGLENVVRRLCRHLDATGVTDVAQAAALVRA
ncbi:MAG: hypothetical protein OEQ13_14600, partial [Acidobacteriota bacterium]|nr:hypothetical protein [Acidobacteriota bacterium]